MKACYPMLKSRLSHALFHLHFRDHLQFSRCPHLIGFRDCE